MTASDRDLVAALRAELAAIDPTRPCDRQAEALGLGGAISTREPAVARLAVRLGREAGDAQRLSRVRARAKRVQVRSGGRGASGVGTGAGFDWAASPEHCRMAYLRGLFLAHGSLSLASARTHLEFVLPLADAPVVAGWLADAGLPGSLRERRGRGVVTWKSAETVGMFLRRIGAGAALLEVEARQVARSLRGDLNRVINAEEANLQRAVAAAGRQIEAIDRLERDGRLSDQPYQVRVIAEARRDVPEATLAELAERLTIHRSAVQRALERIERLALHDDEGIGRRGRRSARAS